MSSTHTPQLRPDPRALDLAARFLGVVTAARPGLVCRAHLTGSALTGDWHEAHSDVDMVFVVSTPVTGADEEPLTRAHAATKGRNCVDGVYLTHGQLEAGPAAITAAPQVVDGIFKLDRPGGQLNGVTWLELAGAPVARVDDDGAVAWHDPLPLATDPAPAAAAYSRDNLATYWTTVADQWQTALDSGELTADQVDTGSIVFTVLGPARLITTIETGTVISKTASGRLAADRWPRHSDLVARCLRSRQGEAVDFGVEDACDTVDLVRLIVAAGQAA